jgi:hypothetical protein
MENEEMAMKSTPDWYTRIERILQATVTLLGYVVAIVKDWHAIR